MDKSAIDQIYALFWFMCRRRRYRSSRRSRRRLHRRRRSRRRHPRHRPMKI